MKIAFIVICLITGLIATSLQGQPATQPNNHSTFIRAEIVERYDAKGEWRAIPFKAVLTDEQANQLAKCFPELDDVPKPLSGKTTFDRMRFQIHLTRQDGTSKSLSVNPSVDKWWNDRSVFMLAPEATERIKVLLKNTKEDAEFVPKSPVVRVEIDDLFDGYLHRRHTPLQAVVTGEFALMLAGDFPELGMQSEVQLAAGAVPRFRLKFIRKDGTKHEVDVFEELGEAWTWCEDNNYWLVKPSAAHGILWILGDPKYTVKDGQQKMN